MAVKTARPARPTALPMAGKLGLQRPVCPLWNLVSSDTATTLAEDESASSACRRCMKSKRSDAVRLARWLLDLVLLFIVTSPVLGAATGGASPMLL